MTNLCLAKFNPDEPLECHIYKTLNVLSSLKNSFIWITQSLGEDFWELVFYALVLHDIGKCAEGFQKNPKTWGYRHEVLSTPFVSFLNFDEEKRNLIALSILTHHKYINELYEKKAIIPIKYKDAYLEKLNELLKNKIYIVKYLFPRIPDWEYKIFKRYLNKFYLPNNWEEIISKYNFINLIDWYENNIRNKNIKNKLIFLKGILNACDHLASAGEDEILNLPIFKEKLLKNLKPLRELQKKANETKGNVILEAPTGYGKTETALLWSSENLHKIKINNRQKHPNRIFYTLPYKASINAMYERLKNKYFQDEGLVTLLHSASKYYFYHNRLEYKKLNSLSKKIYSPIKVLTPFQIMKSFFSVGIFEMNFVEFSNSLLIFDEIHAYEPNITGIILGMLEILQKDFDAKVFLMSATLPTFLENEIRTVLNNYSKLQLKKENLDNFTRHIVKILDTNIINIVENLKKEGNFFVYEDISFEIPLLIVCNTVDRAIEVYKKLKNKGLKGILIHSRFTYEDRETIEKKIKNYLYSYDFVVSTQVIEVSLDISFNSILTEPAPLDALVQRFGRVNRQGWINKVLKPVYILTQGSEKDKYIYSKHLVKNTLSILKDLNNEPLRESLLKNLLDDIYKEEKNIIGNIQEAKKQFLFLYKHLKPLFLSRDEEKFYELFKGIEVIPLQFKDKVYELLEEGKFVEIQKYFVPLSIQKYYGIRSRIGDIFIFDKNIRTIFVDLKYSKEFGLLASNFSSEENWIL